MTLVRSISQTDTVRERRETERRLALTVESTVTGGGDLITNLTMVLPVSAVVAPEVHIAGDKVNSDSISASITCKADGGFGRDVLGETVNPIGEKGVVFERFPTPFVQIVCRDERADGSTSRDMPIGINVFGGLK